MADTKANQTAADTNAEDTKPKPKRGKGVQVSTIVTEEQHAALMEIRWTRRIETPADVVRVAIAEFIANNATEPTA